MGPTVKSRKGPGDRRGRRNQEWGYILTRVGEGQKRSQLGGPKGHL